MLAHSGSHLDQAESVGECSRESRADTIPMFEKARSSEIFFTRLWRVCERMLCVSELSDVWACTKSLHPQTDNWKLFGSSKFIKLLCVKDPTCCTECSLKYWNVPYPWHDISSLKWMSPWSEGSYPGTQVKVVYFFGILWAYERTSKFPREMIVHVSRVPSRSWGALRQE